MKNKNGISFLIEKFKLDISEVIEGDNFSHLKREFEEDFDSFRLSALYFACGYFRSAQIPFSVLFEELSDFFNQKRYEYLQNKK